MSKMDSKLNRPYKIRDGRHCIVLRGLSADRIAKLYDRDPGTCVLKIFNFETLGNKNPENFIWGDDKIGLSLFDASRIQNYMAIEGLAPRVYTMLRVSLCDKIYAAQLCEDVGHGTTPIEESMELYDKVIKLGNKYGFEVTKRDVSHMDVINGKLVDFNTFKLTDDHKEKIRDLVYEHGKWGKNHYQAVPDLGIKSLRDTESRIKWMDLNKIDFHNRSVIDIGCSSGVFLNYATEKGALKCTGYDDENNCKASAILSYYLGHFNNDYIPIDLSSETPNRSASIVLFLSMMYHIGIPDWLYNMSKELCIVEWNNIHKGMFNQDIGQEEGEKWVEDKLKEKWNKVELKGRSKDHGNKKIWWCTK